MSHPRDRLALDTALVAHLDEERVEVQDGVERVERPVLPRDHVVEHGRRYVRDERRRDRGVVELFEVALDLSRGHTAGVEREHLVVEVGQPTGVLGHDSRLEGAVAVAWDADLDVTVLGFERL